MKYNDWLAEEVMKALQEMGSKMGQIAYTRGGAETSGVSIYGDDTDELSFKGKDPDKNPSIHAEAKKEKPMVKAKKGEEKAIPFSIPKLVPTEAWGDPSSTSRGEVYKFFSKFPGKTLKGKINHINNIAYNRREVRSTAKILSTLVFFDSLSSVVKDFTASSAGFVFEGFLAALLNGSQEVERSAGGTLDITDLRAIQTREPETGKMVGGYPISLKLLTKGGTQIKGSYANLVGTLAEGDDQSLLYVVVAKDKSEKADILEFHEFTIDSTSFMNIMETNKDNKALLRLNKEILNDELFISALKEAGIKRKEAAAYWRDKETYLDVPQSIGVLRDVIERANYNTQDYFSLIRYTIGYYKKHGAGLRGKAPELPTEEPEDELVQESREPRERCFLTERIARGPLGVLMEGEEGTQFHITQSKMKGLEGNYEATGVLDVSPEFIKQIVENYAVKIETQLKGVYDNLKTLTDNVNEYFLSTAAARRTKFADAAVESAKETKGHADELATQALVDDDAQ